MLAIVAMLSTLPGRVAADEKPPHISWLFPAGGQRGKTVEVTVGGAELAGARAVKVTGKGVEGKVSEAPSDKIKTLKLTVTIAADAELGQRDLCIQTAAGVSNWFHFFVGQLPEVNEVEPNDDLAKAQTLPTLPVLVNGQINGSSDKDFFRFEAKAGQTLVFTVDARAILPYMADAVPGWLQAVLTLYDAQGKELACADGFRHKQDTVLIYKVPADGQYLLEIRDSLYRAREDFVYRLSIGALPYITDIYPLGGKRGTTVAVELHGVNLPQSTMSVKVPTEGPQVLWLETAAQGLASNRVKFEAGELEETSEVEPNDTPQQANRVSVGSVVNGRIGKPGDLDYFVLKAAAQQKLVFEVRARRLDSPLDSVLTLLDSKGQKLAQNDDIENADEPPLTHQADSRLEFKVPADGDYVLRINDAQRKGGEEYAYRLNIMPDRPDFDVRLVSDLPQRLAAGDTAVATVAAVRRGGYDGEIRLALKDAPTGFVMRGGAVSQKRGWEDGNETRLTITAPADAAVGTLTPRIVATAEIEGKEVVRPLVPTVTMKQAFSINHLVPVAEFLVNVAAKEPGFVLATDVPADRALEVAPGGEVKIPLQAVRGTGAEAAIALVLNQAPWGFSAKGGQIEAGKSECALVLTVDKSARPGRLQSVVFSGTMDTGQQKWVRFAPAVLVKVATPVTATVAVAGQPATPPAEKVAVAPPPPAAPPAAKPAAPSEAVAKPAAPAGPYKGTPHGGKPWPIPGKIEVEDFDDGGQDVAYHVGNPGKGGVVHRPKEVVNLMPNGGRIVLNANSRGDWLNYTVDVAATGTYDVVVCMATAGDGRTIHFELDGADVTGPIEGTNKNWDYFVDVVKTGVKLTAGRHVLRLCQDTGGYDFDYIKVTAPTAK
jgi:hypothetical protein